MPIIISSLVSSTPVIFNHVPQNSEDTVVGPPPGTVTTPGQIAVFSDTDGRSITDTDVT